MAIASSTIDSARFCIILITARSFASTPVNEGPAKAVSIYSVIAVHSVMNVPSSSSKAGTPAKGF